MPPSSISKRFVNHFLSITLDALFRRMGAAGFPPEMLLRWEKLKIYFNSDFVMDLDYQKFNLLIEFIKG